MGEELFPIHRNWQGMYPLNCFKLLLDTKKASKSKPFLYQVLIILPFPEPMSLLVGHILQSDRNIE